MKSERRRRCQYCKDWFTPDPRSRYHQRFCSKARCRKASKAASQKHWHSKPANHNHWRGPEEVERVRVWRKENPGYWRRWRRRKPVRYKMTSSLRPAV